MEIIKIGFVHNNRTMSLRSRTVTTPLVPKIGFSAIVKEETKIVVYHGGTVANSYGYPSWTQTILIIADKEGYISIYLGEAAANKTSLRGAAESCMHGSGDYFDERCGPKKTALAKEYIVSEHKENLLNKTYYMKINFNKMLASMYLDGGAPLIADYMSDIDHPKAELVRRNGIEALITS